MYPAFFGGGNEGKGARLLPFIPLLEEMTSIIFSRVRFSGLSRLPIQVNGWRDTP